MNFIERVHDLAQPLPRWLRPSFYGAVIIGCSALFRSAILLPISARLPMGQLFMMWGIAILGGALAGGVWTISNRWLMRVPLIGPYLTGTVTVASYVAAVLVALAGVDVRIQPDIYFFYGFGIVVLVFGIVLGYALR